MRDVVPERIADLEAGRVPIYEPGLAELLAREPRAHALHARHRRTSSTRRAIAFVCVGTPSTYSGDADLSAVWHVLDELPELERARDPRHEEHRAGRHGREGPARARRARPRARRLRLEPGVPRRGNGARDFMKPGPGRRRRLRRGRRRRRRGALRAARRAGRAHGRGVGRDGQARLERVPRDEDQLHQRDRERLRGDGRRRRRTSPRAWASTTASARTSSGRASATAGSCFPKDVTALKQLAGNSGYHFQLLTAVIEVNELQKRRVVGKLVKHLGPLRGKTIALLGLAFKPNTNDMRDAPSLVLAPRLLAEGARVRGWDPVALEEARRRCRGVELGETVLEARRGRRRRGHRHRVGRARALRVRDPRRDAQPAHRRRAQPARPGRGPRRRVRLRGDRPRGLIALAPFPRRRSPSRSSSQ